MNQSFVTINYELGVLMALEYLEPIDVNEYK